jgi:hypothetical protein
MNLDNEDNESSEVEELMEFTDIESYDYETDYSEEVD